MLAENLGLSGRTQYSPVRGHPEEDEASGLCGDLEEVEASLQKESEQVLDRQETLACLDCPVC
jgi:hypothetical protein